jgi:hypothetical protein
LIKVGSSRITSKCFRASPNCSMLGGDPLC